MNPGLYLRDPESSESGRSSISHNIDLIIKPGPEEFTFRKLTVQAGNTEVGMYSCFKNKQLLLIYIVA